MPTSSASSASGSAASSRASVMRGALRIMMFKPPCTLDDIGSNPDWESLSAARLTARSTCDYERGVDCIQGALHDLLCRRNARQGHDFRLGLSYECRGG